MFDYAEEAARRVNGQNAGAVHYRTPGRKWPELTLHVGRTEAAQAGIEGAVPPTDRRVRRTRRSLHEALIALILEGGYERVTVQDILDRADVGRSTFYAHFRDKEALLLSSFDDLRADLRRDLDAMVVADPTEPSPGHAGADRTNPSSGHAEAHFTEPAGALFAHAYRHRPVYRALCGRRGAGTVIHRHLHDMVGALLREHLTPRLSAAGSDLSPDLVSEFCASALLGLLTWWVDQDFPGGPDRMASAYGVLAAPGIRAALGA